MTAVAAARVFGDKAAVADRQKVRKQVNTMLRYVMIGLMVTAGVCLVVAGAAMAAQETVIYGGDLKAAPAGVALGSWGSGSLKEVSEVQFQGAKALKLVSQGDFQGGRLDFATAIDISGYAGQPNAYIEMWVRPYYARPQPTTTEGAQGAQPAAPGQPAAPTAGTTQQRRVTAGATSRSFGFGGRRSTQRQPGTVMTPGGVYQPPATGVTPYPYTTRTQRAGSVLPGGRMGVAGQGYTQPYGPTYGRTGVGGRVIPGAPGAYGRSAYTLPRATRQPKPKETAKPETPAQTGPASPEQAQFRTEAFRVQLTTDKGTAVLADYPIYPGDRNAAGWVRIGFPLRDFKGPIGDRLDRIALFGEQADTVYIGEMKLALDTTPVEARPAAYPAITKVGQPVTFLLNAKAGLTPLRAVWDFNASNGIQEEATGTRVTNVYDQPGDYEATVTVSDATGANPEKRTYVVLVRVK